MKNSPSPAWLGRGARNVFTTAERYRWLVWSILVAAYMIAYFHRLSVSVVREPLAARFGLTAAEFGTIASMYFYAYCLAQIPAGLLVDRVGARLTAGFSMFITAAGTIIFGYADSMLVLCVGRFIVGLGVSACIICVLQVQAQWYKEREFSTLSGVCLFTGNLGSLCGQTPLVLLMAALSFEKAFLVIGLGTLFLGFLCFALVSNKPEDAGFAPINPPPEQAAETVKISVYRSIAIVLGNRDLMVTYLFFFFMLPQLLTFAGAWSATFIQDVYGLSLAQASNIASLQIVGFMIGTISLGYLSDRSGRRKPFILYPSSVTLLIWIFLASAGERPWPLTLFAACLFGAGCFSGATSVVLALCKELSPRASMGTAIAALNTFGFMGIAIATPIYGAILDRFSQASRSAQHGYALMFMAAVTAVGVLATLGIRETHGQNIH